MQQWAATEIDLLARYFTNNSSINSLYQRLLKISPDRTFESMSRKLRHMRESGFTRLKDDARQRMRVGYLDIETTDLSADWGHILTWYIKYAGQNKYASGAITKKEIFDETFDRRITAEILKALDDFDILWTHWGADRRFDLPFIRTRAFVHGLEHLLPKKGEKFIMDTWPIARNKLRLKRNSLDAIGQALNIKGVRKTHLDHRIWRLANVGNEAAIQYIMTHNKRDVQLLERIHKKLDCVDNGNLRGM